MKLPLPLRSNIRLHFKLAVLSLNRPEKLNFRLSDAEQVIGREAKQLAS